MPDIASEGLPIRVDLVRKISLVLIWGLTALLTGCSRQTPDLTNRTRNEGPPDAIQLEQQSTSSGQERTPTKIRFEATGRLPNFAFNNGGEHPQGSILETLGGGCAVFDFDRDGWPDVCLAAGGRFLREDSKLSLSGLPIGLFQNPQEQGGDWAAVSRQAGFVDHELFSLGIAASDFNNDGFTDVCVTGYGPVRLYQNQGDGTFSECAQARGVRDGSFSASAAWGDLNGDGALDLYICHYVTWNLDEEMACRNRKASSSEICGPKSFPSESDRVFLSEGDGTFQEKSAEMGLQQGGKGLGVVIGDVDRDGDVDVYVANDTTANFLYLNNGHGRLEEVGAWHGVAYDENGRPTGSMGVALADYDNDGLPDLWTTNFEFEALSLFRNMGRAQFHSVSRPAGVTALYGQYVSWGTAFADFDCDGDLDIVVANGHLPDYVPPEQLAQQPFLLVNDGRHRFTLAQAPVRSYFDTAHSGRGLAIADIDRDGQLDVVISHLSEPAAILRNTTAVTGSTLRVVLVGRDSNRDGVGTTAVLETSMGSQLRQLTGGCSYLSTSEAVLHWGFPAETVLQRLTLYWPSGKVQAIEFPPQSPEDAFRMQIIEPRRSSVDVD